MYKLGFEEVKDPDIKITMIGDCSHKIKRHLLLGRKAMTNLGRVDIKDIPLPTNFPHSQSYDFSSGHVWM